MIQGQESVVFIDFRLCWIPTNALNSVAFTYETDAGHFCLLRTQLGGPESLTTNPILRNSTGGREGYSGIVVVLPSGDPVETVFFGAKSLQLSSHNGRREASHLSEAFYLILIRPQVPKSL